MDRADPPPQAPLNPAADRYGAEALARSRSAIAGLDAHLDLAYGATPGQRVDLFLPAGGGAGLPTLLFFHGGGWTHGHKAWCGFMAPPLLAGGVLFAAVGYRLLPTVGYRDAVDDAAAALNWAVREIAGFGGDPGRLFVGGHSAGAHIAALLALDRAPGRVRGCFCISGTFNRRMVNAEAAPDHVPAEPFEAIGADTPLAHAANARAPFVITWGGQEHERLERTGRQMIAALTAAGAGVDHFVSPGFDHFATHLDTGRPGNPWTAAVLARMTAAGDCR